MQREEAANASVEIEVTEEPKAAISLEELAADMPAASAAVAERATSEQRGRAPAIPGLRTARVLSLEGRVAKIAFRGAAGEVSAALAPDVDRELIEDAIADKDAVLVEVDGDGEPLVVGMVQTKKPRELHLKGEKVVIEASREVLLRSGRSALRLREDGDVELVGSRISAASRGLFRIVGRILRLN